MNGPRHKPDPAAAPVRPGARAREVERRLALLFVRARRTGPGELLFREILAFRLGDRP